MKARLPILLSTCAALFSISAHSQTHITDSHLISAHISSMSSNQIYVSSSTGEWGATGLAPGAPSCGPQSSAYILKGSNVGYDEIFSSMLAAAVAGKTVAFYGNCDTPLPGLFEVTSISVQY